MITPSENENIMHYILWDIDGVLSPHLSWDLTADNGWETVTEGWATWSLNKTEHASRMLKLVTAPDITCLWISSWEQTSNHVNRHFGIPEWEWVPILPGATQTLDATWKLPTVQNWMSHQMQPDDQLIWVDDELKEDAYLWASQIPSLHLITPDPSKGITSEHWSLINAFLR